MIKEELIEYLKENLSIQLSVNRTWESEGIKVEASLYLGDERISYDDSYAYIN